MQFSESTKLDENKVFQRNLQSFHKVQNFCAYHIFAPVGMNLNFLSAMAFSILAMFLQSSANNFKRRLCEEEKFGENVYKMAIN